MDCNNDVLIGGFNETYGSGYGFCVVNQSNTYALRQKTSEFRFKIDGSVTVVAYLDGEKGQGMKATTLKPDSEGYYNIDIPVGDGVFFTVSYGD